VPDPPGGEKRRVFDGKLVSVEVWQGRYREVVHHPGSCAAVPLLGDDVVLVRQFRDAVGDSLLEIPAGTRDRPGEDVAECAAREVLEETGYRVLRIEPLGWIYNSPGYLDERVDLFVAHVRPEADPEEDIEVVTMPLAEAVDAVRTGLITDAKSAVALLLVADRLPNRHT
jgi:8-oxo-dGTP pyrophosphatase MutT (NUDIX family)